MCFKRAIIILLNGLTDANNLSKSSVLRLKKGIEVFDNESYVIPSTGFTINKPPFINDKGFPAYESTLACKYLTRKGIDKSFIMQEKFSHDTISNAFFTKTLFIDVLGIKEVHLVTSDFHMERSKIIFEWIYNLIPSKKYKIFYHSSDNDDGDEYLSKLRNNKEKRGIAKLLRLVDIINNQKDLLLWLMKEHRGFSFYRNPIGLKGYIRKAY